MFILINLILHVNVYNQGSFIEVNIVEKLIGTCALLAVTHAFKILQFMMS